jgi:hypothetical protein
MSDEELQGLLRSLPREGASEGFTEGVMARLDEVRRPLYRDPRLALAASLVLAVALWFGIGSWRDARQQDHARERVRALRTELEELQKDVSLMRELAPVLYLGGDDEVDLVIDMRRVLGEEQSDVLQPISLEDSSGARKGEIER